MAAALEVRCLAEGCESLIHGKPIVVLRNIFSDVQFNKVLRRVVGSASRLQSSDLYDETIAEELSNSPLSDLAEIHEGLTRQYLGLPQDTVIDSIVGPIDLHYDMDGDGVEPGFIWSIGFVRSAVFRARRHTRGGIFRHEPHGFISQKISTNKWTYASQSPNDLVMFMNSQGSPTAHLVEAEKLRRSMILRTHTE